MRLLKQRGALTVETMSAMTVMDKSIKSSAHVKYPTEKDRPRGAGLNLVASRGTWVSESLVQFVYESLFIGLGAAILAA